MMYIFAFLCNPLRFRLCDEMPQPSAGKLVPLLDAAPCCMWGMPYFMVALRVRGSGPPSHTHTSVTPFSNTTACESY